MDDLRRSRWRARHEQLRNCALDLFEERGAQGTTVEEIARRAGVTHRTFYRHFPTKEAAVLRIHEDFARVADGWPGPGDGPLLRRLVSAYRDVLTSYGAPDDPASVELRRVVVLLSRDPEVQAASDRADRAQRRALTAALRTHGESAATAEVAVEVAATVMRVCFARWPVTADEAIVTVFDRAVADVAACLAPTGP